MILTIHNSTKGWIFFVLCLLLQTRALAQSTDLVFLPDAGIRVDSVAMQRVRLDDSGMFYLYYTQGPQIGLAISHDGLDFTKVKFSDYPDLRYQRLPDGTCRNYFTVSDSDVIKLVSISATDCQNFSQDAGFRYTFPANDSLSKMNVYMTIVNNTLGGVLIIYLAGGRLDNARSAYSLPGDNGWNFSVYRTNIFGDSTYGGGNYSFWDPHAILLPDGRIRVVVMNQHGPPVPPAVPKGTIYSFTSENHGATFKQDTGILLRYDHFTEFRVLSLNDPKLLRLPDGRYRIYVAAMISDGSGNNKWAILSATTLQPTSVMHNDKMNKSTGYRLYQNYPNPFNPSTTIRFSVPQRPDLPLKSQTGKIGVTLKVFELNGREVATLTNREFEAGEHIVRFTAKNLASGVYIYQLQVGQLVQRKKMLIVK